MEGSYNKVLLAKGNVPAESFNYFIDILLNTVRLEIVDTLCSFFIHFFYPIEPIVVEIFFRLKTTILDITWGRNSCIVDLQKEKIKQKVLSCA